MGSLQASRTLMTFLQQVQPPYPYILIVRVFPVVVAQQGLVPVTQHSTYCFPACEPLQTFDAVGKEEGSGSGYLVRVNLNLPISCVVAGIGVHEIVDRL